MNYRLILDVTMLILTPSMASWSWSAANWASFARAKRCWRSLAG